MKKLYLLFAFVMLICSAFAENGYRLWLRYELVNNPSLLTEYRNSITSVNFPATSAVLSTAKDELLTGLEGLTGRKIPLQNNVTNAQIVAGTPASSKVIA